MSAKPFVVRALVVFTVFSGSVTMADETIGQAHIAPADYRAAEHYDVRTTLQFPDFSLQYLGTTSTKQEPDGPTVSFSMARFLITEGEGVTQTLEVMSGQLPPQPQNFTVKGLAYTLYTYKMPDGSRIWPEKLVVTPSAKK